MKCPKIARALCDWIDGEAAPGMKIWLSRHAGSCAPCRRFFETLRAAVASLKRLPRARAPKSLQAELRRKLEKHS